jgi:hypothetical protein
MVLFSGDMHVLAQAFSTTVTFDAIVTALEKLDELEISDCSFELAADKEAFWAYS